MFLIELFINLLLNNKVIFYIRGINLLLCILCIIISKIKHESLCPLENESLKMCHMWEALFRMF